MSEKLKPCPFCGGEAELVCNDIGVFVGCFHENCPIGPQTSTYLDGYATEAEAIAAWNARAERTCELEINIDMTAIQCDRCGYKLPKGTDLEKVRFCAGCGAKVAGE